MSDEASDRLGRWDEGASIRLELRSPEGQPSASLASTAHGWFMAPSNDEYIGRVLLMGGTWDEGLLEALLPRLPEGGTVVDVGAHVGAHTIPYARRVGPEGMVLAFEPQRIIYQQLCANIALNGLRNVFAYQLGLGHADGLQAELDAKVPEGQSAGELIEYGGRRSVNYGSVRLGLGGEAVELCTLDSFALPRLDLLKVDAEGAEPLVFYGAQETLARCRPIVLFEAIENPLTEQAQKALSVPEAAAQMDIARFCLEELGYAELQKIDHFNRLLLPG